MPDKKIFLLYSDCKGNEEKIIRDISDKSGYWLYLGPDYLNFKSVESVLSDKFEFIEISEKLDKISDFLREDYNNYIDSINRINKDSFEWWFTPLSSRNIYLSEIFQNICYLQLVKEIHREYPDNVLLIVIESYSTGMFIEKWANDIDISVKTFFQPYRGIFYYFNQAFLAIGKTVVKALVNYSFAKISRIRSAKNFKKEYPELGKKTALIDLFVYESNFGDDRSFNDRYFPGLESYLQSKNYNVIYHPTFAETKLNKYNLYRKMRENKRLFLIGGDYLHIFDYVRSLIMSVKIVKISGKIPCFKDYDIYFADKCENKWLCFDGIFMGILIYYLFLRLGNVMSENIERVICWHENQLQDKALSLAVHNSFSNTKVVGVQHLIHYSNYLSLFPLNSEAEASFIPDVILTTGSSESEKLKKYLTLVPVTDSAALRYSHLFNKKNMEHISKKDVIVLLPYDRNDAFEVIMRVGEIISDIWYSSDFIFKCHPDYGPEIFSGVFNEEEWFEKINFTDKKPDELMYSASVVISTASGSVIEAAVSGVPTILLAKYNALSLNPLDSVNCSLISICYDKGSLKALVEKYLKFSSDDRMNSVKNGDLLKIKFFTPVNENTMEIFLK